MAILERLLGRKPTTAGAAEVLARLEGEAVAAQERLVHADAALDRIADMSDAEHAAALAERDAAHRALARIGAQIADTRAVIAELAKSEAVAAATKERDAADRRLAKDYPTFVTKYEKAAAEAAEALARLAEIDAEVARLNRKIVADSRAAGSFAGLDLIEDSTARFRSEADAVEPDRVVIEDKVMLRVPQRERDDDHPRRDSDDEERWSRPRLSEVRYGRPVVPAGAALRKVERVIPGKITRGRRLSSPADEASLPAARVGAAPFWPRG